MLKQRLRYVAVVVGLLVLGSGQHSDGADAQNKGKGVPLELGKAEEGEARGKAGDPNHGYVGQLGSFIATNAQAKVFANAPTIPRRTDFRHARNRHFFALMSGFTIPSVC